MRCCINCVRATKKASAEEGAIPKTVIDKATNDIAAAQELAAKQVKAIENA